MARRKRATVREAADAAREAFLAKSKEVGPDTDRLGDLLLYDLTDGFRCPAKRLAKIFESHGLDPKHVLPVAPDWPVAFGRAIESVGAKIREADYKLIDAAKGEDGERRVSIVAIERADRVTTKDVGTVVCPAPPRAGEDAEPPYIERSDRKGFARLVIEAATKYNEVYTTDDVRTAIVEHVDRWMGLPLRRRPPYVAYWIPAASGEEIRKLRAAVEEAGAGEIELLTSYAKDKESKRAVVNTVNKGLEARLNEFKADVEKFTTKDTTKLEKLEDLIEESKRLRERGALYRDILGAAVESVAAEYQEIEKVLAKRLGIVEKEERAA